MGKSFQVELAQLTATQQIAANIDVALLRKVVMASIGYPVYCVGSGGSFTVASVAADLFLEMGAPMCKAVTPLELITLQTRLSSCAVWCFSSSGKNPDVLAATRHAVQSDTALTATICARPRSPLFLMAKEFPQINHWEFSLPSGRDGFLATNSLVAMVMLLMRACGFSIDTAIQKINASVSSSGATLLKEAPKSANLARSSTLVVIHSPELKAIALDLESKLVEAGLMNCQIADYRSFAHGRHHWLAKHRQDSSVLILATDRDVNSARVISRNMPEDVVQQLVHLPGNRHDAILTGLNFAMKLVGRVGDAKGVDPGRPGVPSFGRRIFNLRSINRFGRRKHDYKSLIKCWVERKAAANARTLSDENDQQFWSTQCKQFLTRLDQAHINAIVLDYDGTLCDSANRFGELDTQIASELTRLLKLGVLVGVATGRGKSVAKALRDSIPRERWDKVMVGYYNGGAVQSLVEEPPAPIDTTKSSQLEQVAKLLLNAPSIIVENSIELRDHQLSIVLDQTSSSLPIWRHVCGLLAANDTISNGLRVVVSSHSVDVLATGVSKLNLIQNILSLGKDKFSRDSILCIGDKGNWPGNDFELLSTPLALSVDEVSPTPATGWNLSQPGMRGMQSCLLYLSCLSLRAKKSTELHFNITKLQRELK